MGEEDSYLQAFDVIFHLALIESVDEVVLICVFPFLFQGVKHHSAQFLNIVLLPG